MAKNQLIRDVMTSNPRTVSESDSVRDAAAIMASEDAGVVPVVDGNKVVGVITDRDIVVRLVAEGKDCTTARVSEAMSRGVKTVREDTAVDEVLRMMGSAQIRRVPVVGANDELVGIVSIGDLAKENKDDKVGQAIENISSAPANN
ncbi:MAG: CBS domain-containing protein [Acidobacteria bacterium]|nr:CBS domain-containing protein [Acidobacteriota bacterium]